MPPWLENTLDIPFMWSYKKKKKWSIKGARLCLSYINIKSSPIVAAKGTTVGLKNPSLCRWAAVCPFHMMLKRMHSSMEMPEYSIISPSPNLTLPCKNTGLLLMPRSAKITNMPVSYITENRNSSEKRM